MNTKRQNRYQKAYELVADVKATLVYGRTNWNYPQLDNVEFVLEAYNPTGRPRVLARGDIGDIAEELSKAWSSDWLNDFEDGGYSDSTIGEWLNNYEANLRIIKPRRKKQ